MAYIPELPITLPSSKKDSSKLLSLKKEAALFFLAAFYFVIATNTQTGWLFVLSAFLLGLLGLSWALSRRSVDKLLIEQVCSGDPQRGKPFRVEHALSNLGSRTLQEVKVESATPAWAQDGPAFEWAVPKLAAYERVTCHRRLTPLQRGEHGLPDLTLICGAPFGLFTVARTIKSDDTILIYPEIEKLPTRRSRSRLATTLGDLSSPRGRGDTHILRTVREYTPGDDLRQVHWKASAKRGPGLPLLVKEHHAPSPSRVLLTLDNSAQGIESQDSHPLFERAVCLTASILWSALRDGTPSGLWLRQNDGTWTLLRHWPRQYQALAKIKLEPSLGFQTWSEQLEQSRLEVLGKEFAQLKPGLVSAGLAKDISPKLPDWIAKVFWIVDPNLALPYPEHPGLLPLDGTRAGFEEVLTRV